jgi:hypothetical protein
MPRISAEESHSCFVCMQDAVPLLPSGCACRSLFACAPCFLNVIADSLFKCDLTCTVCRREISEECVVAVCDAAAEGVAELPLAAPERYKIELIILDVMVERSVEAGYQRTERVMEECMRVLGPEHIATVSCAFRVVKNLMQKEDFVGACALAETWENKLSTQACAHHHTDPAAANAIFHMFHFKAHKAMCLVHSSSDHNRAEVEFAEACGGLFDCTGSANDTFVKAMNLFGIFMTQRVDKHFVEERRRTRRSCLLWRRAMTTVHAALQVLVVESGPNDAATQNMRNNFLVLKQIGETEAYELVNV